MCVPLKVAERTIAVLSVYGYRQASRPHRAIAALGGSGWSRGRGLGVASQPAIGALVDPGWSLSGCAVRRARWLLGSRLGASMITLRTAHASVPSGRPRVKGSAPTTRRSCGCYLIVSATASVDWTRAKSTRSSSTG
jgi:hypothetical protein